MSSRITTLDMASICADALVDAGFVKQEDFSKVEAIIEEEIRVRLALGNEIEVDTHTFP
jgi:hypothetical protein